MEYVSRDYFPIDDCLEICEEKGIKDACAVLYKRKGEYQKSISLYIEVLTKLSKDKVISAVFINENMQSPFNDPETKNMNIKRFDELLTMIIDICDKYGSRLLEDSEAQELWLYAIDKIYQIKQEVMDEDEFESKDLENFQTFLLTRI
jgi:tetratricopeptide (TPR) repeat protein